MADTLTKFLRIKAVRDVTGLSQSTIYERMVSGKFPKAVPLGDAPNSPVGWIEEEIAAWQAERVRARSEKVARS